MARAAEAVGFDSVWVGDHLLYRDPGEPPRGPWEAWSVLAAVAAVTERVAIGPLVASASFHNPAMLAKKAAAVHEISGGRLILGLGAGWNEPEYRAFGFPFDHRVDRFEEAFAIIRGLLREGAVDLDGRYHQARDCVLLPPMDRPAPPIMLGTTGERMIRLAAAHADSWNAWYSWFGNRPEGLAPLRDKVDAACREMGRDPSTLERTVAVLVHVKDGEIPKRGGPREQVEPVAGPAEEVAAVLRAFAAEGIAHVQLVLDPITVSSIEALGVAMEELDRGSPAPR
jgi:alkanesulfonate monooxygenase SsuD/methylene tetrahydromethanopterin reductase-like flavin-dependent oxidoreductase (luciferase family)